jgi:hypothetical protein
MPKGIKGFQKGYIPKNKGTHITNSGSFKKGHKINNGRKHSDETRKKLREFKGEKAKHWEGGRRIDKSGYIHIYNPNHPFKTKNNCVMEHRLVVEERIGRYLIPGETVHHLEKTDDNRPQMLIAFITDSAHQRFHNNPDNVNPSEIIFDGRLIHSKE